MLARWGPHLVNVFGWDLHLQTSLPQGPSHMGNTRLPPPHTPNHTQTHTHKMVDAHWLCMFMGLHMQTLFFGAGVTTNGLRNLLGGTGGKDGGTPKWRSHQARHQMTCRTTCTTNAAKSENRAQPLTEAPFPKPPPVPRSCCGVPSERTVNVQSTYSQHTVNIQSTHSQHNHRIIAFTIHFFEFLQNSTVRHQILLNYRK